MKVDLEALLPMLRCPATGSPLSIDDGFLVAANGGRRYPIVDGVPVLIAEERSLFDLEYSIAPARSDGASGRKGLRGRAGRLAETALELLVSLPPTRSLNLAARRNYREMARLLDERASGEAKPRLLVVGGRIAGVGIEEIVERPDIDVVETDIALGPRTQLICDAHDLPFGDGSFDAVVIQAVVNSVIHPDRVASEVHRVLRDDGVLYSEAPFVQQVTEGAIDFHRFTHVGHRRLWRWFDEISSGVQCGPGMALLWSLQHFLQAFAGHRRILRALIGRIVLLAAFWLKYMDHFLARRPAALDAASATFFLGRRRATPLSDREIARSFRGVLRRGQRLPALTAGPGDSSADAALAELHESRADDRVQPGPGLTTTLTGGGTDDSSGDSPRRRFHRALGRAQPR